MCRPNHLKTIVHVISCLQASYHLVIFTWCNRAGSVPKIYRHHCSWLIRRTRAISGTACQNLFVRTWARNPMPWRITSQVQYHFLLYLLSALRSIFYKLIASPGATKVIMIMYCNDINNDSNESGFDSVRATMLFELSWPCKADAYNNVSTMSSYSAFGNLSDIEYMVN